MSLDIKQTDAVNISNAVRTGERSASEVCTEVLSQIYQQNPTRNCFTTILSEQAIAQAQKIDQMIAEGKNPGALAGVPFGVKNLFDITGITTLAGSKINRENHPATQDATAIKYLKQAGAILVGALNMDEYAYGLLPKILIMESHQTLTILLEFQAVLLEVQPLLSPQVWYRLPSEVIQMVRSGFRQLYVASWA